jgi:hypothetical protein
VSFPFEPLEEALLSRLREIDPREVLPRQDRWGDKVLALTGKRADLDGRIEKVKAQLIDGGEIAPLVDVLRALQAKLAAAEGELAEARREAASPLSGAWGEFPSLLDALDAGGEDARVRLRSVLRRTVEGIWCLFMGKGSWRLAGVQVWFVGGAHRDYVIAHKPATGGAVGERPAQTLVRALADAGKLGPLDLRKRADARKLEAALATLEPDDFVEDD